MNTVWTIWKFPIEITHEQVLSVPENAKVLHVGLDPVGTPCLWCQVVAENRRVDMPVALVGTGHPNPTDGVYRGTFHHGHLVLHVFTK